jgi:hypothetical protein
MRKSLTSFFSLLAILTAAPTMAFGSSAEAPPFFVLDSEEMRSFKASRKDRYFTSLANLLASHPALPQASAAELKDKGSSPEDWDELSEKIQSKCSDDLELKEACAKLAKLRLDTINAGSSRVPAKKQNKNQNKGR